MTNVLQNFSNTMPCVAPSIYIIAMKKYYNASDILSYMVIRNILYKTFIYIHIWWLARNMYIHIYNVV